MHIFNVRKGQFVYRNNQLHKVYSVNPFLRKSIHLVRLRDFTQHLSTAREINLYKPQHLDSFTFNHVVYTLDKNKKAEVGDYILVVHPRPDSIDQHYLHAIEMIASLEPNGVITTKSNGIKHREYWVMTPETLEGSTNIDLEDSSIAVEDSEVLFPEQEWIEGDMPRIGAVYEQKKENMPITAMVIALKGETIYLAGGHTVSKRELEDPERWEFKYHVAEFI